MEIGKSDESKEGKKQTCFYTLERKQNTTAKPGPPLKNSNFPKECPLVFLLSWHESQFIKKVVDTILDRLFALNSCVDEDLVGLRARFQVLESRLDIGSDGVRMVGIWGVGGGGKTTLATSVYMGISQHFQGHCIVENVREETRKYGLIKLQRNILSALFQKKVEVHSVVEGKCMMKSMLCHRKVLVLLDDVDKLDQLEALAGKHNWFGSGSRIIITTRDEHLLRTHRVDHVYPVTLLSNDEAVRLFKRHAYNEQHPIEDYGTLSLRVVSYAAGLPLAIKVLGSFLYDKNKNEWISALDKLKDIPDLEVMKVLKISYDGLDANQKALFLDIACFWRFYRVDNAIEILEACGYHPEIGIKVLRQKGLLTVVDGMFGGRVFDMHDLVQEMGHYIVRGKHPNNPESHSRVWKQEDIKEMCFGDARMENNNIEAMLYEESLLDRDYSLPLGNVVSKMKKLRWLSVSAEGKHEDEGPNFLSNELRYISWTWYPARSPFPNGFLPMKLVVLKLGGMLKELWKGDQHLPYLKVLHLEMLKLVSTPSFDGLPCLQKLTLSDCHELEEIHQSLGNHTRLEYLNISSCRRLKIRLLTISRMKNIKALLLRWCRFKDGEIPCGIGELSNLQELNLMGNKFSRLDFSLSQLTRLKVLNLSFCYQLLELPKLPSSLAIITAHRCRLLTSIEDFYNNHKELCQIIFIDGWSNILLQSMLKGNASENKCMHLILQDAEIPNEFTLSLLRGGSCRLELPENWCNDFCGFLLCIVFSDNFCFTDYDMWVGMKQVNGMDYEDDVVWEESGDGDKYVTWVWYVPFGSLRHTAWWDQTYKYLEFDIKTRKRYNCHNAFGVRLVANTSRSGQVETSTDSFSHYKPKIKIKHDLASELTLSLCPYDSDSVSREGYLHTRSKSQMLLTV